MNANSAHRDLPGHIQAALGATDSAGQPWDGRDLSGDGNPLHHFANDDGLAPTAVIDALARLVEGTGNEAAVVAALAQVRVFVPVMATLPESVPDKEPVVATPGASAESGDSDTSAERAERDDSNTSTESSESIAELGDKHADMALVTLAAPDGRAALPIFTDVETLAAWHPDARPVAVFAPRAALSAVQEEAQLLVLNPGSEMTFVVRRPAMWALAQQHSWRPSYDDPRIVDLVEKVTGAIGGLNAVVLHPGSGIASRTAAGTVVAGGGVGPELRMTLVLVPGVDPRAMVERVQEALRANRDFATAVDSLEMSVTMAKGE